jgi:hypothetical protein
MDEKISELRQYIAEFINEEPYTDEALEVLISTGESLNKIAGRIWRNKAASFAHLVTISEGGSTRAMSDLYKNALAMAKSYEDADAAAAAPDPQLSDAPYTTTIIRA